MKVVISAALSLAGALAIANAWPSRVLAQHGDHDHALIAPQRETTPEQKQKVSDLVEAVRTANDRFRDVEVAKSEQYEERFGCVSGGDLGAMGVHYVKDAFVGNPELKIDEPELLVYEPQPNGRLRLVAADWLVPAELWHTTSAAPPDLAGQLFHLFEFPNRFALPAFYTLHVWAWKSNPNGTFANWNPNVSCDHFKPSNPHP
jgi:hypothetical protein